MKGGETRLPIEHFTDEQVDRLVEGEYWRRRWPWFGAEAFWLGCITMASICQRWDFVGGSVAMVIVWRVIWKWKGSE